MYRIKSTNPHSDHSTVHQSNSAVREISKPVKIAKLIGSCKKSQNDQSNTTVNIRLPERLTPYLKSASNKKKTETNIHVKLSHNKRNVRRNLNFTKIPTTAIKTKTSVTISTNHLNDNLKKENSQKSLHTRKSFLLPPNTVKDLYIKNKFKQSKSMLPQPCISTYSVCDNKYPRISEGSEGCPSPERVTLSSLQIDSVIHEEVNKTVIQRISSQFIVNDQSGIDILHCIDTKNDAVEKEIPKSSINVEKKKCSSMITNNYRENQSPHNVQMICQSCSNLNHSNNKNDEYVTFHKANLTLFASKVKHDICRLEEDVLPNLRTIYTNIMDVLSANKESDNNDTKIVQQMTEDLNKHVKIINNINTKSLCMVSNVNVEDNINTEENINIEDSNTPKEIYKTPDINLMKFVKTPVCEQNNSGIRLLCQNDPTSESNKENDSFVDLENKLDIINIKSNRTIVSLKKCIPVLNKCKNKKEETPLKEYMALKSRMSCLLTPKHFNSQSKNDNLHCDDSKAFLSENVALFSNINTEEGIDTEKSNIPKEVYKMLDENVLVYHCM